MRTSSVTHLRLLTVALIGWLLALVGALAVVADEAVVRFHFFYSEDCEYCRSIKDEFFPTLLARYGDQIEINYLEISDLAVFEQMVALEGQYNVPSEKANIPEVYIGDHVLIGEEEIRDQLPGLIDQYLAEGGVDLPPLPGAATGEPGKPVVRFFLFYGETCPHCHEVMQNYLPTVYEKYGDQVEYQYFEVWSSPDNYVTMLGLLAKLGVPEEERGYVPALVIGDKVLVGSDQIPAELEGYIDHYLAQGGVDFPSLEDLPPVEVPTPTPTVQALLFFDPADPGFQDLSDYLTNLMEKYEGQLQIAAAARTSPSNAALLDQLAANLGGAPIPPGDPVLLIDHQLLVGDQAIREQLPSLVDEYLAQGGLPLPSLEELAGGGATSTATPAPVVTEPAMGARPIYLAYFEKAGCQECARTTYDLRLVESRYPQLKVETFAIEENQALNEWLSEKYDVPEEKRLTTPMIFVGQDVLIGAEANAASLLAVVGKYASTGAERTWEDFDPAHAEKTLVDRFRSFGLLTVLGAGLIDGLNPCAFATLIFFISYLTFTGRRGRDVLFVGLSFTAGVFLTYLLVGVGLLKVIQSLAFFSSLGRWVYLLTALLCAALASLTFRDFYKARQGQASEMTLKLPLSLRRRINKVIRESAQARALVVMAFFTGFVVSLIELACTGQVYLPTIMFVLSVPAMAARAFFYLVLYSLMFITPLVVVFALSYFGATSDQLRRFIDRHTSTIKFATGVVFVGLALWMTWILAPLFGLRSPWNWALVGGVAVLIVLGVVALRVYDARAPQKPTPRRRRSRA